MSIAMKRSSSFEPLTPSKKSKSNPKSTVSSKQTSKKEIKSKFEKKNSSDKNNERKQSFKKKKSKGMTKESSSASDLVSKHQSSKSYSPLQNSGGAKSKFMKKGKAVAVKKSLLKKKGLKVFPEIPEKLINKDGKPKWNELKEEKKKLKEDRKTRKCGEDQYKLAVEAKSIWEKLRDSKNSAEKKEQLVNKLFMLLKSDLPNVVHSHDMARVVQWMLKLGTASVRTAICEAFCANKSVVLYLQSKYASFCVRRALRYGSDTDRMHLIQSCSGQFLKLLNHSYAHRVVEQMYSMHANAVQRKNMHRELYGEMHALLPPNICLIKDIPENMKAAILVATKKNLVKLLSKKEFLKSTLLQSVLKDFLSSCNPQDCSEVLELIQGDILELLNSKEGSRVALMAVWHATNKMKKAIVKNCKGKVKEISTSEFGHILLMGLFDCIDDTVLIKKALIPELLSEAEDIVRDEWGRKVILYLVAHRDPAYFHPQQIQILAKGDVISSRKKDVSVREQEMLEAVSGPLLEKIAADPQLWLGESSVAMVSLAIMKSGKGESLQAAFEAVVTYMLDPKNVIEVNNREFHIVEHSALHLVFKKLIQGDKTQTEQTQDSFATILALRLTEKNLNHILQFNRGCFLLVILFESSNKKVRKIIKSKITEGLKKLLQKQETTGSKILLKKLTEE